ncbi:MAG: phosphoribosylglycinamide formyltransferase [Candidatus Omnitrophota bacterium]
MNIAVFCSGNGTNLQAIIDAKNKGKITGAIKLVVSDTARCFALERAKKAGIKIILVERKDKPSKEDFEKEIILNLKKENIDLVVLAGYMRLLSNSFVRQYKNKILNIHPALLPSFKGMHGIKDAYLHGVKVTGPTVHFVSEDMDEGPIVLQKAIVIKEDDTEETLEAKIHREEHRIYPEAIQLFVEGRLNVEGRRVKILPVKNRR